MIKFKIRYLAIFTLLFGLVGCGADFTFTNIDGNTVAVRKDSICAEIESITLTDDEKKEIIDIINSSQVIEEDAVSDDMWDKIHDHFLVFNEGDRNAGIWLDKNGGVCDIDVWDHSKSAPPIIGDIPSQISIIDADDAVRIRDIILNNSGIDLYEATKSPFIQDGIDGNKVIYTTEDGTDIEVILSDEEEQKFLDIICEDLDDIYRDISLNNSPLNDTVKEPAEESACDWDIGFKSGKFDVSIHTDSGNILLYSEKYEDSAELAEYRRSEENMDKLLQIIKENLNNNKEN